jgi:hypothetical protein
MAFTRYIRPQEGRVRAKRIGALDEVVVESKTLGTTMSYVLEADNLSRTGMLLNIGRNVKVPFLVNTLLELTVDTRGTLFERPVQCLGKIVRLDRADDERAQFGVHIVQIDTRELETWEKVVERLETTALPAA